MYKLLRAETSQVLERTQDETGLRINLEPTEKQYPARTGLSDYLSQPQRKEITIAYRPTSESVDYFIAHEAVRVLRYCRAPPEQRYAFVSTKDNRKLACQKMIEDLQEKPRALRRVISEALPIFYEGLQRQLFSMPGDFWINQWLYENYPGFRGEMKLGLWEIFFGAHQGLRKDVEVFTPKTVYKASTSMNAAFGSFVSELFSMEEFVGPYLHTEYEGLGGILREHNATDRGYPGDKETTDAWARELGVEAWYGWRTAEKLRTD